jgi:hypothetical protein
VRHSLRVLVSRRGLRVLTLNALATFGLLSGVIQLVTAVWDFKDGLWHPGWIVAGIVLVSLAWGLSRALPPRRLRREFQRPDMVVSVVVGDLFDQEAHLVVGFSDTFDTDTTDNVVISAKSVLGQLLHRVYGDDRKRLDAELDVALAREKVESIEPVGAKRGGKTSRYAIGTVAVLGSPAKRVFGVAYTRMGNDLIARSSVDHLWHSLTQVWDAVYLHGQRERVAIPLIGAEFARISCLDRDSLLKMILLSFVARSRENPVCRELTVVIHSRDYEKINLLEVDAFLQSI